MKYFVNVFVSIFIFCCNLSQPRVDGQLPMELFYNTIYIYLPWLGVTSLHRGSQTAPGKNNDMMAVSRMPYLLGRGG